jgi:parallel beta-helix repeat protein
LEDPQDTGPILYPAEPPDIPMPEIPTRVMLSSHFNFVQEQKVSFTDSIELFHFTNCEISIKGNDISIKDCHFSNSVIYVEDSENITFKGNFISSLDKYETTALVIKNSEDISVKGCWFSANYIGMGIHGSSVSVSDNRFTGNNGHNALVINGGSSVEVTGNYFNGSFPHAILVLNREKNPDTTVNIHHNIIEQSGEDAINFEDFSGSAPSYVSDNIITDTGWSAILVEYNSWDSNVTIEGNWIEGTGINWELPLHPLNPEEFLPGWGHGILVEDSSNVKILNNRIADAEENGIEITNGWDIIVTGNGISCKGAGVGVHGYNEASLYREFSPLLPEDAGYSSVIAGENIIFQAEVELDVDDLSELIPTRLVN